MVRCGGHLGVGLRTHDDDDDVMRERGREGQGVMVSGGRGGIFSHDETNKDGQRTEEEERRRRQGNARRTNERRITERCEGRKTIFA